MDKYYYKRTNTQSNYHFSKKIDNKQNLNTAQIPQTPPKKKKKGNNLICALLATAALLSKCSKTPTKEYTAAMNEKYSTSINLDVYSDDYFYQYNSKEKNTPEIQALEDKYGAKIYGQRANDKLTEAIANNDNKINGYIDENIAQGIVNDCWLITAVENMSYTPKGAQLLHEAISSDDDGNIKVYLKGPNLTYTITKEEMNAANKPYTLYSRGDDDMLAIEIAVEKFRQDVLDNKIEKNPNVPNEMYYAKNDKVAILNYGEIGQAYWLLAGNANTIEENTKEGCENLIERYIKDPENSLMSVILDKNTKIKDINGQDFTIYKYHGYGVKKIENGTITLVSASYSNKEIQIPLDELYKLPLVGIDYCNLNSE